MIKPKEARGTGNALEGRVREERSPGPLSFTDGSHAQKPCKRQGEAAVTGTRRVL